MWHVWHVRALAVLIGAWSWRQRRQSFWRRVEARAWDFGPKIFGLCWSKAVEDHGIVSFRKSWADFHRFERLGRGSSRVRGGAWRCVPGVLDMKFLGFVDRSPFNSLVVSVLWNEGRFCADFEKLFHRSLCVLAGLFEDDFPGFCWSKSLEDFCGLIFCEILSEIVEIWNGRPQPLLAMLPPWSTLAVAILTTFDNPGRSGFKVTTECLCCSQEVGDTVKQETSLCRPRTSFTV